MEALLRIIADLLHLESTVTNKLLTNSSIEGLSKIITYLLLHGWAVKNNC
jgi:hypothetical protein